MKTPVNNIEDTILDLISVRNKMDEMTGDDPRSKKHNQLEKTNRVYIELQDRCLELVDEITGFYKKQIKAEYKKNGRNSTLDLHQAIISSLQRNEGYEMATGTNVFNLTEFTRNLINK